MDLDNVTGSLSVRHVVLLFRRSGPPAHRWPLPLPILLSPSTMDNPTPLRSASSLLMGGSGHATGDDGEFLFAHPAVPIRTANPEKLSDRPLGCQPDYDPNSKGEDNHKEKEVPKLKRE
jgi:hypothetical protein